MSLSKAKLILTVGLSGSGKSTWAAQFVAEDPVNRVEVNRDDIRLRLYGREDMYKGSESKVTEIQLTAVEDALKEGKTVVVSDTNLIERYRNPFYKLASKYGVELVLNDSFLSVPLDVCIERDSRREHPVGEGVIRRQHSRVSSGMPEIKDKFYRSSYLLPQDVNLPKAVIFDVDGTLTLGPNQRSPYDMSKVLQDEPNLYTLSILDIFSSNEEICVFILSGREEKARDYTLEWLNKHSSSFSQAYHAGRVRLFMREDNNYESDVSLKERFYLQHIRDFYHVVGVFDDRLRVCVGVWYKFRLPLFRVGNPTADF